MLDFLEFDGMKFNIDFSFHPQSKGIQQINFASGVSLSALAPTLGSGGTIQLWGDRFVTGLQRLRLRLSADRPCRWCRAALMHRAAPSL